MPACQPWWIYCEEFSVLSGLPLGKPACMLGTLGLACEN